MDFAYLIGVLVFIAIILFGIDLYLYEKNKSSYNPVNPIYNPPTYSIQPIPNPSNSVFPVEPTQVPNYGQVNGQYYTNNNNQCVPCSQNNAVGWIIENNSTSSITVNYSNLFSNNNCSTTTNKILTQVNQNSSLNWNSKTYNGTYATLYYDSPFYFRVGSNGTSSIDPSYFATKPGDIIYIAIDNENIAMSCNGIHQVVPTPQ